MACRSSRQSSLSNTSRRGHIPCSAIRTDCAAQDNRGGCREPSPTPRRRNEGIDWVLTKPKEPGAEHVGIEGPIAGFICVQAGKTFDSPEGRMG